MSKTPTEMTLAEMTLAELAASICADIEKGNKLMEKSEQMKTTAKILQSEFDGRVANGEAV